MQVQDKALRATIAHERRVARAERQAAIEAHKAANTAPPSNVSWSTKPDPRSPKLSPIAVQRRADAEATRTDWARRHPKVAREQRALRKGRAELLDRWKHKNEGTPETHERASKRNQGALVQLYKHGTIDADQLAAAVEIATIVERIGRDVAVKTASLETRVDVTRLGDGSFFERLGQVRREVAYTRWRAEVRGPLGAVLDMIVGEPVGFTIVARRYRMHNRRARQLLIDALDLWPRILGNVCKEVDEKSLNTAHARLTG